MASLDLASRGDLIFLVGQGEKQIRLRVNSCIMKNASPVFAVMLGPNFSEGQRLMASNANGQPVEIEFPEDDPDAFTSICRILYWCKKSVSNSTKMLAVAQLADKYDLTAVISPASNDWIRDLSFTANPIAIWKLLIAAYLIGSSQSLERVSRQLVLMYDGSFWDLAATTPDFDLSFKLAFAHEEKRTATRLLVNRLLVNGVDELVNEPCYCLTRGNEFSFYLVTLYKKLFQKSQRNLLHPLNGVFKQHDNMGNCVWNDVGNSSMCCHEGSYGRSNIPGFIKKGFEDITSGMSGICLDCFRKGKHQSFSEHCCEELVTQGPLT